MYVGVLSCSCPAWPSHPIPFNSCCLVYTHARQGLMSLDPLELEVKRRVGTEDERKHAEKVSQSVCACAWRQARRLVMMRLGELDD